jgi:hypothetical protein
MPGMVRRILIFAAVDGLILQPASPRNHKPTTTEQAIKVEYKTNVILPVIKERKDEDTALATLDTHGIVGTRQVIHISGPLLTLY